MACYQPSNLPSGVTTTGRTGYATEAECLQACKEGACCEGTTCSVKPQCQCQGAGKTFKGVGTTCVGVSCCQLQLASQCPSGVFPQQITASIQLSQNALFSGMFDFQWYYGISGTYTLTKQLTPSQGFCAYYFARVPDPAGSGATFGISSQYLITQSSGVWVSAVTLRVEFTTFDMQNWLYGFPSSGPCIAGGYIPVSGCLAASAILYRDDYYSNYAGVSCSQRWRNSGTISVTV